MNNERDPAPALVTENVPWRVTAPNWARCTFNSCLQCLPQLLNSSHLYSLITNKSWFIIDIITISFKVDCPLGFAMWPFGYCETLNIWVWEFEFEKIFPVGDPHSGTGGWDRPSCTIPSRASQPNFEVARSLWKHIFCDKCEIAKKHHKLASSLWWFLEPVGDPKDKFILKLNILKLLEPVKS